MNKGNKMSAVSKLFSVKPEQWNTLPLTLRAIENHFGDRGYSQGVLS